MGCDSKRRRREDVGDTTISSSKKQKLMPVTGLEQTQKVLCCGILQELIDHRLGSVAVRIPDSQEVRRPMDLSTVKSKLERDNYSSIDAFVADVRLTFQNALWYYPPGVKQRAMAKNLGQIFEAKWKLGFPETRSSSLKASCASLDRFVSPISPVSPLGLKQLNNNKREAKRSSRNLDEEKGSASAITSAVDKDKEHRIKRGLDEGKGSASAITCAVNKDKEHRIKRLREQARKEILRVEEAARLKVENPLQDLQQLKLLCSGGIKQDSCYRVYRWLTLEKLGIYLKRDELEDVDEDEFRIGDWEEDGEQSPQTTK
ncbi:uncharacterized protein LOC133738722 isoform X1 [Rosa rugosa]|uniref:uncharacterized protein LOC133738722 isoform X1 n=1 Tax=Rosa rugosa TaxID=74645 RepID=UPI002B4112E7|nr:uncharacterized protein LOC133738722 isoform X1 [Rosa rugosa]